MALKWFCNNDILSGSVDDEIVLLSIEAGNYFNLSSVGTRIWELLSIKPSSLDELVERLLEEYDVDRETCMKDVQEFIEEMAAKKLIFPIEE